jgi:hypothetical protein
VDRAEQQRWVDGLRVWIVDELSTRWRNSELVEHGSAWGDKGHRFLIKRFGVAYSVEIGYHVANAHPVATVTAALQRDFWLEDLERRGCIYVDLIAGQPIILHCM